jgi:hypothetical protein
VGSAALREGIVSVLLMADHQMKAGEDDEP